MRLEDAIPNLDYHVMQAQWQSVLEGAIERVGARHPGRSWSSVNAAVSRGLQSEEEAGRLLDRFAEAFVEGCVETYPDPAGPAVAARAVLVSARQGVAASGN